VTRDDILVAGYRAAHYHAISNRDYYLVQGLHSHDRADYVLVNFLTDLLYSAFNPRIRQ